MTTKKQKKNSAPQSAGTVATPTAPSNKADVLLVIPLREELQNIQRVFGGNWIPRLIGSEVYYFWRMDNGLSIAAIRLREMGNQPALEQTSSAIEIVHPRAVFCIGLGGSLHPNDLRLGDVGISRAVSEIVDAAKISSFAPKKCVAAKKDPGVSASEATPQKKPATEGEAAAKAPAEEAAGAGYYLELMSRQFEASVKLVNVIGNLHSIAHSVFTAWQQECARAKSQALSDSAPKSKEAGPGRREQEELAMEKTRAAQSRDKPEFEDCHFASGLVMASSNLKLRASNREYKVIETEGAGVARACTHRESAVPFVIFRGICDLADENKGATETGSQVWPAGLWRRIAAENAARLLKGVLELPMMKQALQEPDLVDVTDIKEKTLELSRRGKIRFRGEDILNVLPLMSGILSQSKEPADFFISAGDLWVARPLLTHRGSDREAWYPIKDVYIVTLDPSLFRLLKQKNLMPGNIVKALVPNIRALHEFLNALPKTKNSPNKRLFHAHWRSLPPFHGYIFSDYVWHGAWGVGADGLIRMQHGDVTILRRDAFPEEYDSIKRLLPATNAFTLVKDAYINSLEAAYGGL